MAVAAALLVGGCGRPSVDGADRTDRQVPEPSLAAVPTLTSVAQIRLPLDAYEVTYDEWAAIALAEARLVKTCAARFGVDYDMPADMILAKAIPRGAFDLDKNLHTRRYYNNDLEEARKYGYLRPPGLPAEPARDGWTDPGDKDLYAYVVLAGLEPGLEPPELGGSSGRVEAGPGGAYPTGVQRPVDRDGNTLPQGGCGGEAASILAGDGEVYDDIYAANLNDGPYLEALKDSRVVAVTRQWSECMASKGYDYDDPGDVGADPTWREADEALRPLPEEVATAVADVKCKQSVNYLGVRVAVESAYQERTIEEHFQDLQRNYRNAQQMLRRANQLATGAGS